MYTKKHCSPFKKSLSYSCLDEKLLQEIRKGLNKIKGIKINNNPIEDEKFNVSLENFNNENILKLSLGKKNHIIIKINNIF